MLLSARLLNSVSNVNNYENVDQVQFTAGDTVTVYFQLVDLTKDRMEKGYVPVGRRYVPASGATLTVTLTNIDDAVQITKRAATQAFPTSDGSIWSVTVLVTDTIFGTVDMILYLNEGGVVTTGRKVAALAIQSAGTP